MPARADVMAPDGSDVRILLGLAGGGMAHFELAPGETSIAVVHRTVEEIWFFVGGRGEMWRAHDEREEVVEVESGIALTIPVGTRFQFRALGLRAARRDRGDDAALARAGRGGHGRRSLAAHRRGPVTFRCTEYSDVVAQMNRRLRLGPPKATLATTSGTQQLADQRAVGVEAVHAVAGARPDPARRRRAGSRRSRRGRTSANTSPPESAPSSPTVERADVRRLGAGVGDVEPALVEREREPVRADEVVGDDPDRRRPGRPGRRGSAPSSRSARLPS